MRNKKILYQSLIGGALLALSIHVIAGKRAHAKPELSLASNNTSFEEVDAFIAEQIKNLNIPGAALAIVEGDRIVHLRSFGEARPGGEPPSPQTPFFIGSLTKSFTALAVMQLVEADKIELDAPVQRYLPWFRVADAQASARITVRHLLNQTSGLPAMLGMINLANFDDRPNFAEIQARALSTLVLTRPAGSAFEYSNLNYDILGLVIEAASGESYTGYIQRHIFDPLQMSHSYTLLATAQQNGLAVGHRYWFGIPIAEPDLPVPTGSISSGQLISSTEDMSHYLIAQLNEGRYGGVQILSGPGIDELHRPAAKIVEMGMSFGEYGMGWISQDSGGARIVSHSGIVPNFGGFMALASEQKKGLVLLYNANHAMMKMTLDEVGLQAAQVLAGKPSTPPKFGAALWVMRAMLLIPILQAIGVAFTLWLENRWRRNPALQPGRKRLWGQHILLPLIPNLSLVALVVYLLTSGIIRFMQLFTPDVYWIALISGSFAGIWTFLRTGLILQASRKSRN